MAKGKSSKKKSVGLIITILVVALGALAGFFATQKLTENDKFEIVGEQFVEVALNSEYNDEGAVVISFGKDISNKIIVENTVDTSVAGEYYVKYTVDDFRFKGVERYRVVTVVEDESESN